MAKKRNQYQGKSLTDFRRNNKIALRNFNENVDLHDIVKLLLVKMLRRKHPNSNKAPIYTEYKLEEPNVSYPDIWMRDEYGDVYVWEIQDKITKSWLNYVTKTYEEVNLIVVPLRKMPKTIGNLKKSLKQYLI